MLQSLHTLHIFVKTEWNSVMVHEYTSSIYGLGVESLTLTNEVIY